MRVHDFRAVTPDWCHMLGVHTRRTINRENAVATDREATRRDLNDSGEPLGTQPACLDDS